MPAPPSRSPATRFVEVVPGGPVSGEIRPPGSKSITNRAVLCAAFAEGRSRLTGALRSEDTEVMVDALQAIGVEIASESDGRTLTIVGRGHAPQSHGPPRDSDSMPHPDASTSPPIDSPTSRPDSPTSRPDSPTSLFVGNSGTTIRFLTAALSAAGGDFRLHGVPRMHERPIGDLIDAVASVIRGSIYAESPGGCPPVRIESDGWEGDEIAVRGNVSSQYLSGLMMAAPISRRAIRIRVDGELVSKPYVEMTAAVMESFAARVEPEAADSCGESFRIAADGYQGRDYAIEPDASAASYFWAAAAISGGNVTVHGLGPRPPQDEQANAPNDRSTIGCESLQGDVAFADVLARMGCRVSATPPGPDCEPSITVAGGPLRGIDVDMNAISDTVQTLAVVALFADGPTRVRGVAHNRFKETDRIADLARELRRLGATVDEQEDGMTITPPTQSPEPGIALQTYGDHRMAMSLALAGLRYPGVRILDPGCTAKTYPEFFADFESLIGRPHRWAAKPASIV